MRERYHAKNPRSAMMRFHSQTAGVTLTAQQPMNNVVRVAYQALAAVLGGTQSLHTNSLDETLALPTEEAVRLALRTQQIIAHETGVADVIDPLGGSYYLESLTDELEREAEALFAEIQSVGGVVQGIESGWFQRQIARSATEFQREVEAGRRVIVGVNEYLSEDDHPVEILKVSTDAEALQRQRLARLRAQRDEALVGERLDALRQAALAGPRARPAGPSAARGRRGGPRPPAALLRGAEPPPGRARHRAVRVRRARPVRDAPAPPRAPVASGGRSGPAGARAGGARGGVRHHPRGRVRPHERAVFRGDGLRCRRAAQPDGARHALRQVPRRAAGGARSSHAHSGGKAPALRPGGRSDLPDPHAAPTRGARGRRHRRGRRGAVAAPPQPPSRPGAWRRALEPPPPGRARGAGGGAGAARGARARPGAGPRGGGAGRPRQRLGRERRRGHAQGARARPGAHPGRGRPRRRPPYRRRRRGWPRPPCAAGRRLRRPGAPRRGRPRRPAAVPPLMAGPRRPIRVLVAKPGLDGHDRGAKVVAAALRDAGMEVIYTGLHQTPEMIAQAAVQEDVDVVGLSILSGAHLTLFPRVKQLLVEAGRDDVLVTGGGIIPPEDMETLQRRGIGRLFGPGTPTSDLVKYIDEWAAEHVSA